MKTNKILGQHFLKSKKIIKNIIKAAELKEEDAVLEIGPGRGILTEELIKHSGKVIAIEKDKRLAEYLRTKFSDSIKMSQLKVIHGDILKIKNQFRQVGTKFKIVANIPYYLTSKLFRQFLQSDFQPSKIVFMVQREVAERIVARGGKESILSISIKVYGKPKIICNVPAKYFSPKPRVHSAILLIDNISKNFFRDINEKNFFNLVKKGFSSKRKLLKNNLMSDTRYLRECKISERARAENLSPKDWKCLLKTLKL
ncbi:MAG: 16S rRNA (adenine(1518)-N(6)/adenine(1519)-N(6))-dimethyltransferase RsmA [Patescibacteria group bacterium]